MGLRNAAVGMTAMKPRRHSAVCAAPSCPYRVLITCTRYANRSVRVLHHCGAPRRVFPASLLHRPAHITSSRVTRAPQHIEGPASTPFTRQSPPSGRPQHDLPGAASNSAGMPRGRFFWRRARWAAP